MSAEALQRYREALADEYARRFSQSKRFLEHSGSVLLDHTSHAMRWNDPFMPVVRRASGSCVEDLDGHVIVDYWQGHFANILGHNPAVVRNALVETLEQGRGLQSGMLHEVEGQLAELLSQRTGAQSVRLTTSGSLGTFYAVLLARAFTGRDQVLKVSGGWHGSQPFGLKGVAPRGTSFDHLESEGLSASTRAEVVLTRFNDLADLRQTFDRAGDRAACLLLEPLLGAGGGMPASPEYLREARRLTEHHGALLLCDEIITGFRFHAGPLSTLFGVQPDLLILGKIVGGGMPVAAVAGRADVMQLATRASHRVKFEGGTYSAHELSLVGALALLRHLVEHEREIYDDLAAKGARLRPEIARVAGAAGVPVRVLDPPALPGRGSSLVFAHLVAGEAGEIHNPDDLAAARHPLVDERLLKATLLLEDLSTRTGLGSVSTAHTSADLRRTVDAWDAGLGRLRRAGLV
jgi:glutamate-1-semialdehyde 2,1-aminomutase